jgi:hypothetical protein
MAEQTVRPEQTRAPQRSPRLPSLETARGWLGLRIDGLGQRTLGRVAGLHVDVEDGKPRWVVIRLGLLAGCTAVPFEHVAEAGGRLWTAYEREPIRGAPRYHPDEALAAAEEIELCAHWGIRDGQGRAGELAGKGEDEITAVPDEG